MMTRREFMKSLVGTVGAGVTAGMYAWQVEPRWVDYEKRPLSIPNLPSHLAGALLIQLSDLHIGTQMENAFFTHHFQQVSALSPDFVVYTGDFVSYDNAEQIAQLDTVMKDAPVGSRGTAAVLGNHDYGHGWRDRGVAEDIIAVLKNKGIPTVRNQVTQLDQLLIGGVADYWSPDWSNGSVEATVAELQQQPSLMLCHNPDALDEPIWEGYQGTILAGHTHGGQCRLPFVEPPLLPVRNRTYTSGEFDLGNGRFLYINRGLGSSPLRVRFTVRPEITLWVLTPA